MLFYVNSIKIIINHRSSLVLRLLEEERMNKSDEEEEKSLVEDCAPWLITINEESFNFFASILEGVVDWLLPCNWGCTDDKSARSLLENYKPLKKPLSRWAGPLLTL